MALKKCRECAGEVSTSAKVCPYCGLPKPTGPSAAEQIGGAVITLAMIAGGVMWWNSNSGNVPKPTGAAERPLDITAEGTRFDDCLAKAVASQAKGRPIGPLTQDLLRSCNFSMQGLRAALKAADRTDDQITDEIWRHVARHALRANPQ